jgi:hypothetical protein
MSREHKKAVDMETALGIYNPNSKFNRSRRSSLSPLAQVPDLPPTHEGEIRITIQVIRQVENLRAFRFGIGDIPGARLQAIRLGCMRAELRRMQRGM